MTSTNNGRGVQARDNGTLRLGPVEIVDNDQGILVNGSYLSLRNGETFTNNTVDIRLEFGSKATFGNTVAALNISCDGTELIDPTTTQACTP